MGRGIGLADRAQFCTQRGTRLPLAISTVRGEVLENTWYGSHWKKMALPDPEIAFDIETGGPELLVTLSCQKPAHFVALETEATRAFSDNSFTLIPDQPVTLGFTSESGVDLQSFKQGLTVWHLRKTYGG